MAKFVITDRALPLRVSQRKRARIWAYGAIVGLLCISGIVGSWYGADWFARHIVLEKMISQSDLLHTRVESILENPIRIFTRKEVLGDDAIALDNYTKSSNSFRVVLFDNNGVAFWSTNTAKIGKKVEGEYFNKIIQTGGTYAELETKTLDEIDGWLASQAGNQKVESGERYVTELYSPVIQNGQFLGAIEHYHDVTDEIILYRGYLRAIGIIGGLALWFVSGIIILQILRAGRQREADLKLINETQSKAIANEGQRVRESRLLSELNEWLQSCRSLDELYDMIATFMTKLLPNTCGSLYIYANSRDVLDGVKTWNHAEKLQPMQPDDCWGLRRGRTYAYGANEIDFVCSHVNASAPGEYRCIPIVAHGETIGLLHLVFKQHLTCNPSPDRDCLSCTEICQDERRLAMICAEQISLAIANVRLRDQLRDQSIRDPLTGLFNRRYMIETCRRELSRARRSSEALSLLSVDVDHFKLFNDNHGHDAGDIILRTVGECLSSTLREEDVACRHGGEEFVVILPSTELDTALRRAEDLRAKVESLLVRYGDKNLPRITISVGVACFPKNGSNTQQLLKVADKALYLAKAEGRNNVKTLDEVDVDADQPSPEQSEQISNLKSNLSAVFKHAG